MTLFCGAVAESAPILSPVSVVSNSAGDFCSAPLDCSVGRTIDQSGLSGGFTSGVTDFDTYLASNPTHTRDFDDAEWFSDQGNPTGTVIYDLGASYSITRLAFWNEESDGVANLSVAACGSDATCTAPVALGLFVPTDNPQSPDYLADVFDITDAVTRYVRFIYTDNPNLSPEWLAVGELAFEATPAAVPEPVSLLLLGSGITGLVARARRRRR